jgi:hypothetical protein
MNSSTLPPAYAEKYPGVSLENVEMGIAMCHFEVALQETGLKGDWQRIPDAPPQKDLEYIVSRIEAADRKLTQSQEKDAERKI